MKEGVTNHKRKLNISTNGEESSAGRFLESKKAERLLVGHQYHRLVVLIAQSSCRSSVCVNSLPGTFVTVVILCIFWPCPSIHPRVHPTTPVNLIFT